MTISKTQRQIRENEIMRKRHENYKKQLQELLDKKGDLKHPNLMPKYTFLYNKVKNTDISNRYKNTLKQQELIRKLEQQRIDKELQLKKQKEEEEYEANRVEILESDSDSSSEISREESDSLLEESEII